MIREIYTYGDEELRNKSADVDKFEDLETLISDMKETMRNAKGAGLAAPQIGINKRIIVIEENLEDGLFEGVFINPKVSSCSADINEHEEACLSLPSISAPVKRFNDITLEWYDEKWEHQTAQFDNMKARILQHEIDHLDGILYTDRIDLAERVKLFMVMESIRNKRVEVNYPIKR